MKITDSIHALKIPFEIPGTGFWRIVYVYIIVQEEITIIDSGVSGSENFIFKYLKDIGRKPEEVSKLLITHAHPDHIGSAKAIQNQTGCNIGAHKNAIRWIENIELQNQERPIPGFFELVGGSAKVNFIFENDEVLNLGNVRLQIFDTPGHSNDSVSFFEESSRILITGDVIPQWNDLPIYDNYSQLLKSLEFLSQFEKVNWLLSSWDDPIKGNDSAYKAIKAGIDYIEAINREIMRINDDNILNDSMILCSEVVNNLGLSESNVNPMVAKSFLSHLTKS